MAYADYSDSNGGLQMMIKNFEMYCDQWNLQENLDKSKIIIFKKGVGKTCKNEK